MAVTINGTKSTLDVDAYMDELDELAGQAGREALLHLPDDFYDARPWTRHIAQKAEYLGMSREALFAAMLAVISSRIPANVKADLTGRDEPMSLNVFVNLSGKSGSGKSRAIGTARRLLPDMTGKVKEFTPASGEALSSAFVKRVKEDGEWVTKQKTDRALMVCTEGAELSQLCLRPGNTIVTQIVKGYSGETLGLDTKNEELNLVIGAGQYRLAFILQLCLRPGNTIVTQIVKGYSGETLGLDTKNEELNLVIGAGQYRLAFILGVQPANATMFTTGIETGLTGRFLYFYTTDESWADRLDEDIPAPVEKWPDVQLPDGQFPQTIGFPPQAQRYARRLIRQGTAAQVEDVDGHRGEHVGRVAALYAIMDGRTMVSMDDWELALRVMDTSDRVRAWLFDQCHSEQVRVEADKVDTREKAKMVSMDDWELALRVMDTSDRVRAWLFDQCHSEQVRVEADKVDTREKAKDSVAERRDARIRNRVLNTLDRHGEFDQCHSEQVRVEADKVDTREKAKDSVAERRDARIRNRVLNTLDRHGEQIWLDGRTYQGLTRAALQRRLARDARYAAPIIENLEKEERIIRCLLKGSSTVVYLDNVYDDYPSQLIDAERM